MLNGIKVLDVGAFGVGPMACGVLALLGADVIRMESPEIDGLMWIGTLQHGAGTAYISCHFNKRNIIVDLKSVEGREIAIHLAQKADVIVENHPPHMMERLGFGYEDMLAVNPRIIYISSSGYGAKGPLSKWRAADHFVQATSGFCSTIGAPGGKPELLRYVVHVDWTTTLIICQAVLMALFAREITGEGQKIDTSEFEASLHMQSGRIAEYFATGENPKPMGSADPYIVPSQAFKTLDNKYINVSVPREEYWRRLCEALGLEQLEHDPRFISNAERVKNREQLIPILEGIFLKWPACWWLIQLQRYDVPCGSYYTFGDICRDPHILENQMVILRDSQWGKVMYGGFPLKFSNAPRAISIEASVGPDHDREEIITEIGYRGK